MGTATIKISYSREDMLPTNTFRNLWHHGHLYIYTNSSTYLTPAFASHDIAI